jgi:riboflavin-specific deaminase-like protein
MAFVRQLHPVSRDVDPREIYADVEFPARSDRPYVALNFVTSLDGRVAVDGRASGLGSPVDRQVMRQLRARADALLVGAGTVRAEAIDPRVSPELAHAREAAGRAAQPLFVVISASAVLPDRKLFHRPEIQSLILTVRTADGEALQKMAPAAEVAVLGDTWVDLTEAMHFLKSRGMASVLCEGGPTVAGGLIAAGLVDELFVTVAPAIIGGVGPRLVEFLPGVANEKIPLDLVSVVEEDGELFVRYHLRR